MTDLSRAERVAFFVKRIGNAPDFPALSDRIRDVMQILSGEDITMQHLANIILKDYSLTMKVLRTANSFHYNRAGTPIGSVTQAMVLLGMETVRDVARSLIVFEHYQGRSAGLKELMILSMLTASHARETAEQIGFSRPEEAHLQGMFHNLGEVLIACHAPNDYSTILGRVQDKRERPGEACFKVLGFSYEELGEAVCRHWGIVPANAGRDPSHDVLKKIVAFSHDLTTSVYRRDGGDSPGTLAALMQKHGNGLGLTPEHVRSILNKSIAETKSVFDSLSVSINDLKLRKQSQAALAGLAASSTEDADEEEVDSAFATPTPEWLNQTVEAMIAPATGFDLNEVLLTILEAVLRAGPFDRTVFCLVNAERTEAIGRFGLGQDVETRIEKTRFALSMKRHAAPAGPALMSGLDLIIAGSRQLRAEEAQLLTRLGARTVALLPVVVDRKLVAALYADRIQASSPLEDSTIIFLRDARDLARRAIARARQLTEARIAAAAAAASAPRTPTPASTPAPARAAAAAPVPTTSAAGAARGAQISAESRYEAVLRVLRGESTAKVGGEYGVEPAEVERWRDAFLTHAKSALGD